MSKVRPISKSFRFAFDGLKTAYRREPNFRIHIIAGVLFLGLGYTIGLDHIESLILLFTISFVIILELINTSLEAIVNLVSPRIHPFAKIAKDVAAAAVLLAAGVAIIVGIVLFGPKIAQIINTAMPMIRQ
ncbi:MAG: diacylglycerol kinase [Candidatus Woesebacteria bacterium GW2011_GWC1_42_9]|nr:MAG: diacylglycerol kinase [Candidatus Woesebacteria bacterium GW2011_GWC1_42_9]